MSTKRARRSGDATCVTDTIAIAVCPACGFKGKESEICTTMINPLDLLAIVSAREGCVNKKASAAREDKAA